MLYNNREYPHPVLGINDSVEGEFNVNLKVKSGRNDISVTPILILKNDEIQNLITERKCVLVIHIYCNSTMYRKSVKSFKLIADEIRIPASLLRDKVEIDFFICANQLLPEYSLNSFHSDYSGHRFFIEKGDILGYAGKGVFNANKSPQALRAISAFMNIDKYEKDTGPMYNFYDGDKITIFLCNQDYILYRQFASNDFLGGIIHSSVVLPALMEAVQLIKSGNGEYADKSWYETLENLIEESKEQDILKIGQKILSNPVNRSLTSIQNLMGYSE